MPAQALAMPTEGIDQALLMVLVARVVRLSSGFKLSPELDVAAGRVPRSWGCCVSSAARCGGSATRWTRRSVVRAPRSGKKPVESWGFIRQIVSNWSQGDGTPGSPPGSKPASPPGVPCPVGRIA